RSHSTEAGNTQPPAGAAVASAWRTSSKPTPRQAMPVGDLESKKTVARRPPCRFPRRGLVRRLLRHHLLELLCRVRPRLDPSAFGHVQLVANRAHDLGPARSLRPVHQVNPEGPFANAAGPTDIQA